MGCDLTFCIQKVYKDFKVASLKRKEQTPFKMQRDLWIFNFLQAGTSQGELTKENGIVKRLVGKA